MKNGSKYSAQNSSISNNNKTYIAVNQHTSYTKGFICTNVISECESDSTNMYMY